MRDYFFTILIFAVLLFGGLGLFLNKQLLGGGVKEQGVVVVFDKVIQNFYLLDLSSCEFIETAKGQSIRFINDQQPVLKYRLEGLNSDFGDFTGKFVKVEGRAEVEERILRPPEIICIQGPCEAPVKENILNVVTLNLFSTSLSECQIEYLEKNYPASI